jgi:hypothetical protein
MAKRVSPPWIGGWIGAIACRVNKKAWRGRLCRFLMLCSLCRRSNQIYALLTSLDDFMTSGVISGVNLYGRCWVQ